MKPRLPIVPTLLVLIAAAIMVRLGFWQLDRLKQKEAMIATFTAAQADTTVRPWPAAGAPRLPGYSRIALTCAAPGPVRQESGRSASGEAGWAHVAPCNAPDGTPVRVVLGWSARPDPATWTGGAVRGTYVPREGSAVVYADPPLAGLQPNARPDPRDLPNNHLAYAVQWFLFAGVALVIYTLAVRKRLRGE